MEIQGYQERPEFSGMLHVLVCVNAKLLDRNLNTNKEYEKG